MDAIQCCQTQRQDMQKRPKCKDFSDELQRAAMLCNVPKDRIR